MILSMNNHTPFLEEIFVMHMMEENPTIPAEAFSQLVMEEMQDSEKREFNFGGGFKSTPVMDDDPELDLKVEEQEAE